MLQHQMVSKRHHIALDLVIALEVSGIAAVASRSALLENYFSRASHPFLDDTSLGTEWPTKGEQSLSGPEFQSLD